MELETLLQVFFHCLNKYFTNGTFQFLGRQRPFIFPCIITDFSNAHVHFMYSGKFFAENSILVFLWCVSIQNSFQFINTYTLIYQYFSASSKFLMKTVFNIELHTSPYFVSLIQFFFCFQCFIQISGQFFITSSMLT